MHFQIPAPSMMELAAAFLQVAVTLGLAGLFFFLYRRYRKPYFGWFSLAWLLYAMRIGAIVSFLLSQDYLWLYWHQVVTGLTAVALLWASLVFSQQLRFRPRYLLVLLFPPLWSYVAIYRMENFLLAAAPAVVFLSGATLWTGWTFLRYHQRVRSVAAASLAGALFLWGLHHLDYPFLRERGAWNPWGYYVDLLFVLAMGAGILLLVLEDLQRGLEALSNLSGQLQRGGAEHEVVRPLLEGTMRLSGVRGTAMYSAASGRFADGAGACAGWTGTAPSGAPENAIRRALVSGRPEQATGRRGGAHYAYAAALPIFRGEQISGALLIVGDARDPFAALDTRFLVALGQQVGAALENADLDRRLATRTAELERLAGRMIHQHEDERRRLSRELHDESAQVFAAVKLELGLVRERVGSELGPRLDRALELVDTGLRSIRSVTNDLRPSLLDEVGLVPALRALVADLDGRGDLAIGFDPATTLPDLSPDVELALFRALQEALANAVRHAGASRVDVRLGVVDEQVQLEIADDGRGLAAGTRLEDFERNGHMGLAGMRERVAGLGGSITIGTAPAGGLRLVLRLPAGVRGQEEA
jgi:signal transduction histidine kinase